MKPKTKNQDSPCVYHKDKSQKKTDNLNKTSSDKIQNQDEEVEFLKGLFQDDTLQFFKNSVLETKIAIVERIEKLEERIEMLEKWKNGRG